MRSGLQSQVPPDFSVGYGTEIEEEVFDLNGLLLALLLAVVALMMAYVGVFLLRTIPS
jgi:hypothetical protein